MDSNYTKIFSGNRFMAQRIEGKLKESGINPVIKDESDSARLAGFAANVDGNLEVYVHHSEIDTARQVIKQIKSET
ncbi:putative signal transducing protein [Pareuzebyella sediminis]|uniref:putative signal transducing protein n=1 Tax=Pareuzebyella sediminis TaxID=2607998 RepID=UPI0011EC92A9|nr:DUF2007 domain-containing protein [Pareuzebyella sediminis]